VITSDPASADSVSQLDSTQQLMVLGGHDVRPLGGNQRLTGGHGDLVPQPLKHLHGNRVPGKSGDASMEPAVKVSGPFKIAGGGDLLEPLGNGPQIG
jgi:hypothetical protein